MMDITTPTSLILGWPTQFDARRKARANRTNPLIEKWGRSNISYALHYPGEGHLVTFAPTGSGKGVGVIIPNLLHYTGPTIVIDPKGENFVATARFRRALGQRILLLDPFRWVDDKYLERFEVTRGRLNPLDLALISKESVHNDAQMIAELLSGGGSFSKEPYWDIAAKKLLSGLIAHEMRSHERQAGEASLRRVIDRLFESDAVAMIRLILNTQDPSDFVKNAIDGGFLNLADITRSSIQQIAQSYLTTVSGDILQFLENSTIDLRAIQSDEDYTLYIVIPPNKLTSHSFLLKMWVGVLMHAVMERKIQPLRRTLFALDECANLGSLDVLRKAVTLLRGYGLQVWMFFQDLSQLETLYPGDFRTMTNNCGVIQAFGISRLSAARPLAQIIGEYGEGDILGLDRTQQILSIAPTGVRVARIFKYYRDPAFAGRFDDNPLTARPLDSHRPSHPFVGASIRSRFI